MAALSVEALVGLWLEQTRDHAVLFIDDQGVIGHAFGSVEATFGYTPEELRGQSLGILFTEEDRRLGLHRHEMQSAAASGRALDDRWQLGKGGLRVWVSGVLTRLHDGNGAPVGFVKVMRDRTDLRAEIDTLRNRVLALLQAKQAHIAVLGTLAHELRNPLAPLSTASQLIDRLATDERLRMPTQIIHRQVAALKRLVDDLTDAARIETGKLQLDIRPTELQAAIRQAVEPRMEQATERGLTLRLTLPPVPITIEVDPQRFEQIVVNLLNNALKYTLAGGLVAVSATVEDADAVLRFADTGIGIAPEMLPRIFDLFTQESAAQSVSVEGLGIGLALVKSLIDAHGGVVEVRSDGRHRGSEFTVRLPLVQPSVA